MSQDEKSLIAALIAAVKELSATIKQHGEKYCRPVVKASDFMPVPPRKQ